MIRNRAVSGRSLIVIAGMLAIAGWPATGAAQIAPHRAIYTMSLASMRNDTGVVDARGTMAYEWGETCNGWIVQQRYRLRMSYAESRDVDIESNFVTWESKDGRKYRFNQQQRRNGETDEVIRGHAELDGPGKGGVAVFEEPKPQKLLLPPGTLFPGTHTMLLIDKARQGKNFVLRQVFDGATTDNAVQVSAFIATRLRADAAAAKMSPLLQRPGWHVRLAFFPPDQRIERPDYELGLHLLDNGVSEGMLIDYGDYAIRATLDDIEALPKPKC
jgi:envelope integrity protein B